MSFVFWLMLFHSLILFGGCSFSIQSSQYQMIKRALTRNMSEGPETNSWNISWAGYEFSVTPMNVGSQTWFANKQNLVVRFDGWQVTKVENLIADDISLNISLQGKQMLFDSNGRNFLSANCDPWIRSELGLGKGRNLTQYCETEQESFENEILVDENGMISRLLFKIHPKYERLDLSSF